MIKKILSRKFKKFLSMRTLFVLINLFYIFGTMFVALLMKVDEIAKCILLLILFLVFKMVENLLFEIIKEKENPIRVNKRFTHKNDDTGAIEIKKEDFQQAILLLYELENKMSIERMEK